MHRMLRGVDVIDALIKLLERDPILKTLKQHQERLDKFDVEQIIDWFRNLDTSTQDMDPVFRENWNDIVRNYAEGREYALGEIRDTEFFLTAMMEFLISSSLKDCSIIITLRERYAACRCITDKLARHRCHRRLVPNRIKLLN
ncbi:hypothetical protein BC829DRAFT_146736 [Chytridium lagenaria]|nr:hypothetical protein BC829DRAFT_146736 [Chytridium lagenaria]